jgi:hypothetical protein
VPLNTNLTATFSERVAPATLNSSTFKLFKTNADGTQTQVTNVKVTCDSSCRKGKLNPYGTSSTLLSPNTKYQAVITSGVRDLEGNALDQEQAKPGNQNKNWSFTTGST